MDNLEIKMAFAVIISGLIFSFMQYLHKKKVERAEREFQLLIKSMDAKHWRNRERKDL